MLHSFDADMAARYGIAEAVLIQHLAFWIGKNMDAGRHDHDGRTWTYNTVKGFADLYPYLSEKQVRRVLDKLESEGVVVTGNYNKSGMDRTLWYAFADDFAHLPKRANASDQTGNSIRPNGQMHSTTRANAFAHTGRPIPDRNPDGSTQMETTDPLPADAGTADGGGGAAVVKVDATPYAEIIDHLNDLCGTGYRPTSKKTQTLIRARIAEGYTVDDFRTVHRKKAREWLGTDRAQYLRPETLYSPKFESYLHAPEPTQPAASRHSVDADPNANFQRLASAGLRGITS